VRISERRDGLYEIENTLLACYKLATESGAGAGYVHNPAVHAGGLHRAGAPRACEQDRL
jgi:hypothetical protein